MAGATFVFVPGAWHSAEIYSAVIARLEKAGYEATGLGMPSVGRGRGYDSFDKDVDSVRQCLHRLIVEEEKNVIVVSHSVNGLVASEAVKGLGRAERDREGLKGGVSRLVYIMALAMAEGFQCFAQGNEVAAPSWMKFEPDNRAFVVTEEDAQNIFYNDLDPGEAKKWVDKLRPQSAGVYYSKVTYAAWRWIPSTFIIGTEDKSSITREIVDYMVKQEAPNAFDTIETCEGGGHCLMISQPDWLAEVLRRACEGTSAVP